MTTSIYNMLALINPVALPALRIAATFFLLINLIGGAYIFRNRHRFFDRDPNVDNDIPAARRVRVEVVLIPWLVLTTLLIILLINLWLD
jgi:hypothetical protein